MGYKRDKDEENESHMLADSWITTKVKSTYMYSSNVDSVDISVSTLDGVVSLKGEVNGGPERALAVELAKNIRGVKCAVFNYELCLVMKVNGTGKKHYRHRYRRYNHVVSPHEYCLAYCCEDCPLQIFE